MKKEINELLTFGEHDKSLQINGIFRLTARYKDEFGVNVSLSNHKAVSVTIELEYIGRHDKMLFASEEITARTYDAMMKEVPEKMQLILSNIGKDLSRQFVAGYLP